MSQRFKLIRDCHWGSTGQDDAEEICIEHRIPIYEWEVNPVSITATPYRQGDNLPTNYFINIIHFPELNLWEDSRYSNYRYKIRVEYSNSSVEWLDFSASELNGNTFSPLDLQSSKVSLIFKNVNQLSPGTYNAVVYIEAYGIAYGSNSGEYFVEHNPTPININFKVEPGDNDGGVYADKQDYYLTFNKSTNTLSGDTLITVYNIIPDVVSVQNVPYGLSIQGGGGTNPVRTTFLMGLQSTQLPVGNYTEKLKLVYDGVNSQEEVNIHLNVVDDDTPITPDFDIAPKIFSYIVTKQPSEFKTGEVSISNPQNLDIQVTLKPSFIDTAVIINNKLTFTTVDSADLQIGDYSGEVVLQSGDVTKKVMVYLKVAQGLASDFNGKAYYFALDGHKVTITKTNPIASYAVVEMNMFFKAFGVEHSEVQKYSYPYFKDKIVFEPGQDVQDFFVKCTEHTPAGYQMNLAPVSISVKEYDAEDNELQESRLNHIFFAPGKTPKCFPLWTDFSVRRTYENSKIRINADIQKQHDELNSLYQNYSESKSASLSKLEVHAFDFERSKFHIGANDVVVGNNYTLIPFPNEDNLIHLFFENQNLVLDWFSCPGNFQEKYDFKHLFDDAEKVKFGSLESKNIVLNTGWILREEVEVINAILKSRICFIQIGDKMIAAKAITKKNELYDTLSSRFNMELEFNIYTDER